LRAGLAFAFFYAGIAALVDWQAWVGWFPGWLLDLSPFSNKTTLALHSFLDILLGFWLLSGRQLFWAALISFAVLAGIVIFNWNLMAVVFRDVALAIVALALAVLSKKS